MSFKDFLYEQHTDTSSSLDELLSNVQNNTIIFFDTETTGAEPSLPFIQITEIAAIAYDPQRNELGRYHQKVLIKPETEKARQYELKNGEPFGGVADKTIEDFLGITQYRDKNAPFIPEDQAINGFKQFVRSYPNAILLGHNSQFDIDQINTATPGSIPTSRIYDSLRIMRLFFQPLLNAYGDDDEELKKIKDGVMVHDPVKDKDKPCHSLQQLGTAFGVPTQHGHSAIADINQLATIFYKMIDTFGKYKDKMGDVEPYRGQSLRAKYMLKYLDGKIQGDAPEKQLKIKKAQDLFTRI